MNVRAQNGALVPLDGLVELERRASVRAYNRFNRQPSVEISASLAEGVDLGSAIATVEQIAAEMPPQMQIFYSGQADSFQETSGGIAHDLRAGPAGGVSRPRRAIRELRAARGHHAVGAAGGRGALLTLLALGEAVNIYTQVGLVMLIGLMAKNGILIVEFANQLREQGMACARR